MGKPLGFRETTRGAPKREMAKDRVRHWKEFYKTWAEKDVRDQGARCMDCAVPFCHVGCPLGNLIPDWNDLVYLGRWKEALDALHSTNNFPEFTGRICPAPCESSCVLSINQDPVTIEYIEKAIVDRGFEEGWIVSEAPRVRTGKKVAVVGSGPAGLAAAQQLNRAGHTVTVFERDNYIGGLLTLGIPDFKLEKSIVQRRVQLLADEGVMFKTGVNVGVDLSVTGLLEGFDAVCLAGGSTQARDLPVPGRELRGVHFAMEYLTQQNKVLAGETIAINDRITAEGKNVVILGGGDTGADCLGTAHRQGSKSVKQFELLPEPPLVRQINNPWPEWPLILRSSAAHEEGGIRDYSISTKRFAGSEGHLEKLHAVKLEWKSADEHGRRSMSEERDSDFVIETELVLLAMGFTHPEHGGLLIGLGVNLDSKGNVQVDGSGMSSIPGVFAAGDIHRGQSLVVWAIAEGRETAHYIDKYLMGSTSLPLSVQGALNR